MIDPQKVRDWLEATDRSRQWLAEEIGAKLGTVNNWFTEGNFPLWAEKHIARIMREDEHPSKVQFTLEEFDNIEAARKLAGYDDRFEFFKDALIKYARSLTSPAEPEQKKPELYVLKTEPGAKVADGE